MLRRASPLYPFWGNFILGSGVLFVILKVP
jgi:hypothetical protein